MKKQLVFLSVTFAAGLLLTNIYNSLIDAKSWGADLPVSIQTARSYFQSVNPGDFYRLFSPANQVLALLTLLVCWKSSRPARLFFGIAFFLFVLTDVLTFAYFYPRNDILFRDPISENADKIKAAWSQWSRMNWVRSAIGAAGLFFSFRGLDKFYSSQKQNNRV